MIYRLCLTTESGRSIESSVCLQDISEQSTKFRDLATDQTRLIKRYP